MVAMKEQLHKRMPAPVAERVLKAYESQQITERQAKEILQIGPVSWWKLKKHYKNCRAENRPFILKGRSLPERRRKKGE